MRPFRTPVHGTPGKLVTDEIERLGRRNPLNELATLIKRGGSSLRPFQVPTSIGEGQALPGSSGKESHLYEMDLPFTHYPMPTSGGGLETRPIEGPDTFDTPEFTGKRIGCQALLSNNPDVRRYRDLADSNTLGLFHNGHPSTGNGEVSMFGHIPPENITHISTYGKRRSEASDLIVIAVQAVKPADNFAGVGDRERARRHDAGRGGKAGGHGAPGATRCGEPLRCHPRSLEPAHA